MFTATVNNKYSHQIHADKNTLVLDGTEFTADFSEISKHKLHIIHQHKTYSTEIVSINHSEKIVEVNVNGRNYSVQLKDQYDALLKQLGMDNLLSAKLNDVKAPMPGLVLRILVEKGQEVKKGEGLIILEAMKMENSIKAPADVIIKEIKVTAGDKVEKNQILIQFN